MQRKAKISIQAADFNIQDETAELCGGDPDVGAVVSFTGLCRSEAGRLSALELEHYPGMAEQQIGDIARTAMQRWELLGVTVIHRSGKMRPGDNIVLVLTASAHRQNAFDGAAYIMDFLKSKAPFWKKEHLKDGRSGRWVEARDADEAALAKWDSG